MRIGTMIVAGKEYPTALTMKGVKEIGEIFGGMEEMNNVFVGATPKTEAEITDAILKVVEILLRGGYEYRNLMGEEVEQPPITSLNIVFGLDDIPELMRSIYEVIANSAAREVEVEADPNAHATQSE